MITSKSNIKRYCLFAYLHRLLVSAEMENHLGKSKVAIEKEQVEFMKNEAMKILDYWTKNHWTLSDITRMSHRMPFVNRYYNKTKDMVVKHFPIGSEIIPLYLSLIISKQYLDDNVQVLPEDIDIKKLISVYEKSQLIDRKTKFNYYRVARDILEGIKNVK